MTDIGGTNNINYEDGCYTFPAWVSNVPHLPFVTLQIQMLVIFFVTQLLHHLIFKHIKMPPLVSQLLAGIIIGPAGLGRSKVLKGIIFPALNMSVMKGIVILSHTLSLFIIATQMDFTIIRRTSKRTILIGLVSLPCGIAANIAMYKILKPKESNKMDLRAAITMLPSLAHPSLVRLITDIGLVNSELGRLALASGLCVEICSIALTMTVNTILPAFDNREKLVQTSFELLGVVAFLLTLVYILRPFWRFLIKLTPKDRPIKESYVLFTVVIMLLGTIFTDFVGQFVLLGAFLVGGAIPDGPPLGSEIVDKLDSFISGVLYPYFVSLSAAKISFSSIHISNGLLLNVVALVIATSVTKLLVVFICGIQNKMAYQDALSFAFLMLTKGFLDIGTVSWLNDVKVISDENFALLALHVILMSFIVPLAVNLLYDPMRKYAGYQIRDIIHLKHNAPLRMEVCILRPDNIASLISLIRLMNPSRDAPIIAQVLHLIKLAGRCQPLLISHDIQKKQISSHSYSEELVWQMESLQHTGYKGVLSSHIFTALSHPEAMHEYICTLALDKIVSVIFLPYHRKFSVEGSVAIDDHTQRILNTSVLARSPCSVAIFIERSHINLKRHDQDLNNGPIPLLTPAPSIPPFLNVAMIFIGGNDDREALAFAQRMNRGCRINLTVIRLAAPNDGEEFLNSLDSRALHKILDTRFDNGSHQINYVQVTVKDGIETAFKVRSMVHEYDLIIVGRRFGLNCLQTVGLEESSEIKELGILGDLLASPDLNCKTSVLIMQQQQHW